MRSGHLFLFLAAAATATAGGGAPLRLPATGDCNLARAPWLYALQQGAWFNFSHAGGAAWTVVHMMKIRFALGKSPRCVIVTVVAGAAGAALLPVSLPISLLVSAAIFAGGLYLVHGWPEEFHPLALVSRRAR